MLTISRQDAEGWLDAYIRLWREADAAAGSMLFTPDGQYVVSPWEKPWPEGEHMSGRDQIAQFWHFITVEHLRFLDGGYDLWAVGGDEAYARWWADLEFREEGYWVEAEGALKLKFAERVDDRVLCSELLEWVPYEPEHARHFEPYPKDLR